MSIFLAALKNVSSNSILPAPKITCGALEVVLVSKRKDNIAHFFSPPRRVNVVTQAVSETRPGLCKTPWLQTAGKFIFMRLRCYFRPSSVHVSQQVPDQWLHALNSCASRHLVNAAQTIKGAAGMTSAWKIPHMERWKTTCGFLSAEASSAAWQGEPESGKKKRRSLIVFLDFSLYIQ